MSNGFQVEVQVIYTNPNLSNLVSVLESNFDLDVVLVKRDEDTLKGMLPFSLIITAASTYIFEKFVLSPLIDPVAKKFNWVDAINKYLTPIQPFNLTVYLTKDKLIIETELNTSHHLIAKVWTTIKDAITILKTKNKLRKISKIRLTSTEHGEILVICYENTRPKFIVDVNNKDIRQIPQNKK